MSLVSLALVSLLALGADGAASSAPPPAPAPPQARDYDNPPPGASPADQALWRAAYDASNRILLGRAAATRLQARMIQGAYEERLDTLASQGTDPARRAEALRARLHAAWQDDAEALTRPWLVDPTRGCRYPLLTFEGVLYSDENPRRSAQLAATREEVRECVSRAQPMIDATARANERLEAALAEVDRELATIPVVPAATPPAPTDPGNPAPAVKR
jgi:hypothetical protein